jgi:hypothetical protein
MESQRDLGRAAHPRSSTSATSGKAMASMLVADRPSEEWPGLASYYG